MLVPNRSGSSADPYLWLKDPDPAFFVSELKMATKNYFFVYYFLKLRLHHFSKIKSHK